MRYLVETVSAFWQQRAGTTAIEYALIIGGIALGLIVTVGGLGDGVLGLFESVAGGFS